MASPRIMVLTGASRGIGAYLRQYYIALGYRVIGCSRTPKSLDHPLYEHHQVDVSDPQSVHTFISALTRSHSAIDILINNAGIASMNHFLLTPVETVEKVMRTNFLGTFLLSREAAKLMVRNKGGRIVNLTSIAVALRIAGEAVYTASKSAVEAFTRVLAKELAPFNITCNAVGPGPIKTDLIKGVPPEKIQAVLESLSIKRFCEYQDVANVIDFFIRPESEYVTGQIIYLGGA